MKTIQFIKFGILSLLLIFLSCDQKKEKDSSENTVAEVAKKETPKKKEITYNVNAPETIIRAIAEASGGWNNLWNLKDVEYTYTYEQADGKKDVSIERYLFDGEYSWGKYSTHQVNVLPEGTKPIVQSFVKGKSSVSMDGKKMTDEKMIATTDFLRQVNYYWFMMNFKIGDPGTTYQYIGQDTVDEKVYDKVSIAYDPQKTGKEANDAYILYVNPETKLIDQFYFSLPAWGINDTVLLMKVKYTKIDGIQVSTHRHVYIPNEKGEYPEEPSLSEVSTDIKFNNGFTVEDFKI
ncbi:hypothetical protein SAMN04487910_0908 [Aquimarina amphilecti]|uniref:Uncharacterized protein n=1 Tax=Aquimarina amphilecti TaxID=1038014 RepID=A0A1H7J950_AQUAM|nr:DUF6503 family protein [Aquimarina amphilecti]SEK70397.1 hypothetical protein SAMN04487910_0908 [Aquimarina amphilecti]